MNQTSIIFYQKNLKELEGYRLFDMVIFKDIIKSLGCPNCKQSTLYVDKNDSKRKGCESYIIIKCFQCTYTMGKYTLHQLDKQKAGNEKGSKLLKMYEGEQVIKYECIAHYQKSMKSFAKTTFTYKKALVVKARGRKSIQMCRRKMVR